MRGRRGSRGSPRSVLALPFLRLNFGGGQPAPLWVNLRRPYPPLRGWIIQQLVKLAVASQMSEKIIVTADSDLIFVRPVTAETFAPGGRPRLYRLDDGVDNSLPRHMRWHAVARDLVGLAAPPSSVAGLRERLGQLGPRRRDQDAPPNRGCHRAAVA